MTRRIFVSDIHMGDARAVAGPRPYGWLDATGAERLAAFLRASEVTSADEVIMVGDVLDLWVCPIDVQPPTARDVIEAPQNAPVVDAVRALLGAEKRVIYLTGNHDMDVVADDARRISPEVAFGLQLDLPPLRIRHGHEGCLFNAPDPTGLPHPIGYYITRMTATGVARGHGSVSLNLWTILKSADEVEQLVDGKPLAECVFDTVAAATGVSLSERCLLPGGGSIELAEARAQYVGLVDAWRGSVPRAIESEWDPWYDLPVDRPHIHVVGHSHKALESSEPSYGYYLNTGTWVSGSPATFVESWDDDDASCARVCSWDGQAHVLSTTVRVSREP